MASNTIEGRAKKHDGTAIDYVSIFNWIGGKCLAQVKPNASGFWEYQYSETMKVGISYVADGCEPVTHGPYELTYKDVTSPIPSDYILFYDFNGDLFDKSTNANNGNKTGSASFVDGRKIGTLALGFTRGVIVTQGKLPITGSQLTVSFWVSTSSTSKGMIYETSSNTLAHGGSHYCMMNEHAIGKLSSSIRRNWTNGGAYNITASPINTDDSWQHVIVEVDTSLPSNEQNKIYVNNALTSEYINTTTAVGDLKVAEWYIGSRYLVSSNPFNGALQDFRVYNRILSEIERAALFNE